MADFWNPTGALIRAAISSAWCRSRRAQDVFLEGGIGADVFDRAALVDDCFDEGGYAHHDVFNTLLQVLDEGWLIDAQGRTVAPLMLEMTEPGIFTVGDVRQCRDTVRPLPGRNGLVPAILLSSISSHGSAEVLRTVPGVPVGG